MLQWESQLISDALSFLEYIARGVGIDSSRLIDYEAGIPTPLGYIVYKTRDTRYLKYRPGEIVIRKVPGYPIFEDPIVKLYHEYLSRIWIPRNYDVLIGLPCTGIKPYKKSVTHKMMNAYLRRLNDECGVHGGIVSVSEPMLIVPQEYEELFPLSNYDFPPKLMTKDERNLMIKKISGILPKIISNIKSKIVFVLPRHHYSIVKASLEILETRGNNASITERVELIGYGRLAFKTMKKVYEKLHGTLCSSQ